MIRLAKTKCAECGSFRRVYQPQLIKSNPDKRKWDVHIHERCGKCFKKLKPIRQDDQLIAALNSWFEGIARKEAA